MNRGFDALATGDVDTGAVLDAGDWMVTLAALMMLRLIDEDERFGVQRDAGCGEHIIELTYGCGLGQLRLQNPRTAMDMNKDDWL
jgi:hypothetical protein